MKIKMLMAFVALLLFSAFTARPHNYYLYDR